MEINFQEPSQPSLHVYQICNGCKNIIYLLLFIIIVYYYFIEFFLFTTFFLLKYKQIFKIIDGSIQIY